MQPTFWLTIAKQNDDQLILTLYNRQPPEGITSIDQITRPWPRTMDHNDKEKDFIQRAKTLVEASKRIGWDVRAIYGNVLVYWLFGTATKAPTEEQIDQSLSAEPPTISLNQIGKRLANAAKGVQGAPRLRLFVCLDKNIFEFSEFLSRTFFQTLSANRLVQLDAVRSVWSGQEDSPQKPAFVKQPVSDRLKVLLVLSNPTDHPLNEYGDGHEVENAFEALKTELDSLAHDQALDLYSIRQPTSKELSKQLERFNPHVFIFLGHGYHKSHDLLAGFSLGCVDNSNLEEQWNSTELQNILHTQKDATDLRLVVFLACQSFVAAPPLLSFGIPAVVGMQRYLSSDFPFDGVVPFAKPLLEALADFAPITTAFDKGVEGLHRATKETADLRLRIAPVMPTLWLAGPEDRLFAGEPERLKTLYKNALLSKISVCEWAGHDQKVTLDQVFVRPTLLNLDNKEASYDDILSSDQAFALEGIEGSGKTTLAHWLVSQAWKSEKIPIFVNLRAMKTEKQTLKEWLVTFCRDSLGLYAWDEIATHIEEYWKTGKAVLVIDEVEPEWLAEPPQRLIPRLFTEKETAITSSILVTVNKGAYDYHADWTRLRIQPLRPEQHTELIGKYGSAVDATPATEDFLQRITHAHQQPNGVTALAERPGFLADMLAQFLRQGTLVTDEADLLDRRQLQRWRTPIADTPAIPDEPVYKQRLLEALGFHLYCCPQRATGIDTPFMQTVLEQQQIYSSKQAVELLQEFVEARPVLRCTGAKGKKEWTFRSPEWLRFYAASQIAALVNDRDKAILAWLTDDRSITCRLCETTLAPFSELADPARRDEVRQAVSAALTEDLAPWRRSDPWDSPKVRELRRVLVRALPLPSR